ncbi:DNRLRE domain-containing protein [Amaricoccus solimangrovi]|uniref:DNRLRE domain-containing protein n=1 Tax=Amaricoccus solimangrovi TaxID=2589815 RepID=A0A501WL64_9RHOB|nr:DNRLRE domain-containing protein [Amaricoccus solimangrovi]TPE49140.1 DNRLRE domain-containing protein [Amaricoccus solimangrovi]
MPTVSFQQSQNGYSSTQDTIIREKSPNSDYRSLDRVNVDGSDSSGKVIQGLLYFGDLFGDGPGQIPVGATITSATLTINVTDNTGDAFSLNRMLLDWHHAPSWTWNAYGNGIQTDGVEAVAAPDLTRPAGIASGLGELDVTTSLQAWSGGAANHGWLLSMSGGNGWEFDSSEGGFAPQLNVTYTLPSAQLVIGESGGDTVVTEGGAGDSVTVALGSAPTANVTVAIAGTSDIDATPTLLTFTPTDWNVARTVTVSAIDDTLVEGQETSPLSFTASSADSAYQGKSATVNVVVHDNDALPPPTTSPTVVAVHDTTLYKAGDPSGYGCSDPSGLAYVPGLDRIFIADSEHEEKPFYSPTNVFTIRTDGTQAGSASLTSFCKEPTGFAYDNDNGYLYITDDDADRLFWVDPAAPGTKVGEINVRAFGITDAEDPAYDPDTGHMFMLDGVTDRMFELTTSGQLVAVVNLPSAVTEPEAMAYDPYADLFYFAGGATSGKIFTVDGNGDLVSTLTLLNDAEYRSDSGHKPKIKGLTLAPSSDPNDGHHMNLYAADYGADQVADGRLFEIDMGITWPIA